MTPQQDTKKCRPSSRTCTLACLTSSQQLLPWSCNHPVSLNLLSIIVPTLMNLLYHWYLHHLSLAVWLQLLLPTMASTANKSKIDQKIATFDKITQTSDVVSWLDDVSLACAITDTAHDKWVLVAGTHMTGAPLQYFKTAYSKARKQGQAALDAFCEWENFVVWYEKTLNRRDHEKHAFDTLASLQQTGTVSDYKSKFDDFAARAEATEKMLLHWWLQGLRPHVREQCIRDPRTNQPFVLLEDSQDAALAVTSYDDNSTTGAGSLCTSTKNQRTNQGTAQATGYKSAVQQPTRLNSRLTA